MTLSECPKCGTARLEGAKFCPNCGFNYVATEERKVPAKPPRGNSRREIIILALVIVVTAVLYNVISSQMSGKDSTASTGKAVRDLGAGAKFEDIVKNANVLMDSNSFDKAIPLYEKALTIDSLHPEIMVDLGACYHAVGDDQEATFQFNRALALDPKQSVALYNMGVVSISNGDTVATKKWWNKYLEVAGNSPQAPSVREQLSKM
jgi:tetratricopeptide (TPR) repeat protein